MLRHREGLFGLSDMGETLEVPLGSQTFMGPPFEGASVLRGLQDFSAEALRSNSFSILSLHRKQSYQSSAGVRVYLAGNMCILTYCLYAAFIPISGRLLATPISGKGGCL